MEDRLWFEDRQCVRTSFVGSYVVYGFVRRL